ncbi:MAG: methyltransferase domain-containing protein [Chloroflexi bacterium]|nr:MAG: methyltransferase domain-containing protein [Chloroflexota bacterium]
MSSDEPSEEQVWSRAMSLWGDEIDQLEQDHWWYAGRRAVILAALRQYLDKGARVLDFGCGAGGLTHALAARYQVLGVDSSKTAIEVAQRRGINAQLIDSNQPLPGGFDAVCALDVLEHLDDDEGMVRRLAACIRPGGRIIVTVPAYAWLWGSMDEVAGHRRRYRLRSLRGLMERAGLRRVHASYFNSLLFPALAAGRLLGLPRPGHEVDTPPRAVNALLATVFSMEAPVASRLSIPFGTSILFIGRR